MKIDEVRSDRIDSGGTTVAIERLAGKGAAMGEQISHDRD